MVNKGSSIEVIHSGTFKIYDCRWVGFAVVYVLVFLMLSLLFVNVYLNVGIAGCITY